MKISECILLSDIDGTLAPFSTSRPCKRNIDAIKRFTGKGGRFGLATGRSKEATESYVKELGINAPCIILNGGGLYDYEKDEYLMKSFLPDEAREYVKSAMDTFPQAAALVIADKDYYHVNREIPFASFTTDGRREFKNAILESLKSKWYKALFSAEPCELQKLVTYFNSMNFSGIRLVKTNDTLLEMLPAASNKGFAIDRLAEICGFKRECIAAIGDYYNDLEMLESSALSATTIDAPDDIKAVCSFIAGKCENGAVADFIEHLEKICGEYVSQYEGSATY